MARRGRLSKRATANSLLPRAGVSTAGRVGLMELCIEVLRGQGLLNLAVWKDKPWELQWEQLAARTIK